MVWNPSAGAPAGDPIYLDDFSAFVDAGQAVRGDPLINPGPRGKWRVVENHYGARQNRLLTASPGECAPILTFKPAVTGRYAVCIGHYGKNDGLEQGVFIRTGGDRHFGFITAGRFEPTYRETHYKTLDFSKDTTIEIGHFGATTAIDYIKLVPVTGASLPPKTGRVIAINDFTVSIDNNKPEGYEAACSVQRHVDVGYDMIVWKAYKVVCEYDTKVGTRRDLGLPYDSMRQAADEARKLNVDLYGWVRINNEDSKGGLFSSTPFHEKHRHMCMLRKDGQPRPRLSFAYPEVRKHKVDIIREVAAYGVAGICIDILRHPPMAEYDHPLVEEYIREFNEDPRRMDGDGTEHWLRFRAKAFTQFLRETRAAIGDLPLIIRTMDQPWRNVQGACDVETWIKEGIVNGLIFAPHLPNAEYTPQALDMAHWTSLAAGRAGVYAQVWRYGDQVTSELLAAEAYQQGVDGVAMYETELGLVRPDIRDNVWRLGRPGALRISRNGSP